MNERLKELYQQAHSVRYHDNDPARTGNPPTVYWQGETSAERFAELIVRECVDHLEIEYGQSALTGNAAAKSVKKHFGVEE